MKKVIYILTTLMTIAAQGQEVDTNGLIGKWKLNWSESGFFPEENLLFESTTEDLSDYIFEFKKSGNIFYQYNLGECPVGVFTMKDGNWRFENGLLTLELRGEKIADYWYWWVVRYSVEMNGKTMFLKVDEIIKNRMLPTTTSWEELINE